MKTIEPTTLSGVVSPPPSKSISHRALILTALSEPGAKLFNLLESEDVKATKEGLERMGAVFSQINDGYALEVGVTNGSSVINCFNSGTTMRLLTGLATLFTKETTLIGDESLNKRPMKDLINALEQLGANIDSIDGYPPITIKSPIKDFNKTCKIRGKVSSQYISSLLITLALRGDNITSSVELIPPIVSKPYVDLTISMLREKNVEIVEQSNSYEILSNSILPKSDISIASDYSSAAFFIVAGALPGNNITIEGLSNKYPQADAAILDFVEEAGAKVKYHENGEITISSAPLDAFQFNISQCPDLFPILCVLATFADGESKLFGASHLRFKETDRIATMTSNMEKMGINVKTTSDGAIIQGSTPRGNVTVDSFGDHRIAMASAILATQATDKVKLNNPDCVAVSYPDFYTDLNRLSVSK